MSRGVLVDMKKLMSAPNSISANPTKNAHQIASLRMAVMRGRSSAGICARVAGSRRFCGWASLSSKRHGKSAAGELAQTALHLMQQHGAHQAHRESGAESSKQHEGRSRYADSLPWHGVLHGNQCRQICHAHAGADQSAADGDGYDAESRR